MIRCYTVKCTSNIVQGSAMGCSRLSCFLKYILTYVAKCFLYGIVIRAIIMEEKRLE